MRPAYTAPAGAASYNAYRPIPADPAPPARHAPVTHDTEQNMAGTPSQTERKTREGKKTIPASQDRTTPSGAKKAPSGKPK